MSEPLPQLISLLLPKGLLSYFDVTSVSTARDGTIHIHLKEHLAPPNEFKGRLLRSHGLVPAIEVQDFPLRGKKCYLHICRRRWQAQDSGELVQRDRKLVQSRTYLAALLK